MVYNEESGITNFAKFAEFPWMVAIIQLSSFKYIPDLTIVASGTLIHPKFVLTTAHTLKSSRRYLARFGEWNLNSSAEIYPRQDIHIERHIIHPSYRDEFIPEYDVALAMLRENIIYTEHIRPLCLPSAEDLFEGQRCIETGWGYETTSDTQATIMKRLKLEIISHERCQEFFDTLDDNFELSRSVMCVEGSKSENTCMKDAGAPLACQRQDGSYVLAGMTSWMLGCHRLDAPSGHVNVTKVVGWINDTIEAYVMAVIAYRSITAQLVNQVMCQTVDRMA
uniref:Peptidase S1 domain-containing protein n=1 Tax=Anopheles culicifacies TaxID=139723 RepID=A0A182MV10_9DIPT